VPSDPPELIDYGLCTHEDVKAVAASYGVSTSADFKALAQLFIAQFTIGAEQLCNRAFPLEERTDYPDIDISGGQYLFLESPPVALTGDDPLVPTIQVWEDGDRLFPATSLLTIWEDYYVQNGRNGALLVRRDCDWPIEPKAVKVTYTGGLVTRRDGDTPPQVPPDLAAACAQQCAAWNQRKSEMNLSAIGMPGMGSIQVMNDVTKLVKSVRDVLYRYTVWR